MCFCLTDLELVYNDFYPKTEYNALSNDFHYILYCCFFHILYVGYLVNIFTVPRFQLGRNQLYREQTNLLTSW